MLFNQRPVTHLPLIVCLLAAIVAVACDDQRSSPTRPALSVNASETTDGNQTDPEKFAEEVREANKDNKILIAVKPRATPPISPAVEDTTDVLGVPFAPKGTNRRMQLRFADAQKSDIAAVKAELDQFSISPYWEGRVFPVLAVQLSDDNLVTILERLLRHSNVDFLEPVMSLDSEPVAGPTGSNPTDLKHDIHEIQGGWDHTRGDDAQIGVLDSGYTPDGSSWHPDGLVWDSQNDRGIFKRGFNDEYGNCDPSFGDCENRDDQHHGTQTTGLVGQNDNDIQYVGVATYATTYSMKVTHNCSVTGTCSDDDEFPHWEMPGDALVAALDRGADLGFEVMSMSFTRNVGGTIEPALFALVA